MKKVFLFSILLSGMVLSVNRKTFAQVNVHVHGVIGENTHTVYQEYPIDRGYQKSLPPGQAKKIYGYKSAKHFAPGHAKMNRRPRYEVYNEGYPVYSEPSRPRVVIDAHVQL